MSVTFHGFFNDISDQFVLVGSTLTLESDITVNKPKPLTEGDYIEIGDGIQFNGGFHTVDLSGHMTHGIFRIEEGFENCVTLDELYIANGSVAPGAGALVQRNQTDVVGINRCVFISDMPLLGGAGGLVGSNFGSSTCNVAFTNCYVQVPIVDARSGGFVGSECSSTFLFEKCYTNVEFVHEEAGGFVGSNSHSSFEVRGCVNVSKVVNGGAFIATNNAEFAVANESSLNIHHSYVDASTFGDLGGLIGVESNYKNIYTKRDTQRVYDDFSLNRPNINELDKSNGLFNKDYRIKGFDFAATSYVSHNSSVIPDLSTMWKYANLNRVDLSGVINKILVGSKYDNTTIFPDGKTHDETTYDIIGNGLYSEDIVYALEEEINLDSTPIEKVEQIRTNKIKNFFKDIMETVMKATPEQLGIDVRVTFANDSIEEIQAYDFKVGENVLKIELADMTKSEAVYVDDIKEGQEIEVITDTSKVVTVKKSDVPDKKYMVEYEGKKIYLNKGDSEEYEGYRFIGGSVLIEKIKDDVDPNACHATNPSQVTDRFKTVTTHLTSDTGKSTRNRLYARRVEPCGLNRLERLKRGFLA